MRFRTWFIIWMLFNVYVLIDARLERPEPPKFERKNAEPDLWCVLCGEPLGPYRGRTYWTYDGYPVHHTCHTAYWEGRDPIGIEILEHQRRQAHRP